MAGVEDRYVYNGGTAEICGLTKVLLSLGIGTADDWEASQRIPQQFIRLSLEHWMERSAAPYGLDGCLNLNVGIFDFLDEFCENPKRRPNRLYLTVDGSEPSLFNVGGLYKSLAAVHPRLPVSFYWRFSALNYWIRVFDHKDLLAAAEWATEGGGEEEDLERARAWKADIPAYMELKPLSDSAYRAAVGRLPRRSKFRRLLELADALYKIPRRARIKLSDEEYGDMDNFGEPYPIVSLHFYDMDAIRGLLDDELNNVMQTQAMPNMLIPLRVDVEKHARLAFEQLAQAAKALGIANEILKLLPFSQV